MTKGNQAKVEQPTPFLFNQKYMWARERFFYIWKFKFLWNETKGVYFNENRGHFGLRIYWGGIYRKRLLPHIEIRVNV